MSTQIAIPLSSFAFLRLLKKNNNREWFNRNKNRFLEEQQAVEIFADAVLALLNQHDLIETPSGRKSMQRIYRDTRFSNNKTPYKSNWAGGFTRATKLRRGGYYYHLEPGNSFIAGGFWGPGPADLKRIRDDIAFDAAPLRKVIASKIFTTNFGALQGAQLKTTPKGFDPMDTAIDLLRYKQFLLIRRFTDAAVLSNDFLKEVNSTYKNMRPFLNYMSEVLTTDINGIVL
ncbi:MAG: DUF2461 domain-containing protein [Chitinophagaceae bacterium]